MSGMIVAPQPIAVEEGVKALRAGGNAVDAAVTCALVQAIVSPQMCGIGGYAILTMSAPLTPNGFDPMLHRTPLGSGGVDEQTLISMDAPALAGSLVTPDMWAEVAQRPNPDGWGYFVADKVNDLGYTSVCAPGTVRALATMLERWGTISWAQALAPAARIAEEGFVVSSHLAAGWQSRAAYPESCTLLDRIQANKEARRIYLHADGHPYAAGEVLRNPDYARTLRQLAKHGPDDLYTGALARRVSEDLAASGSFVTAGDLAAYPLREPEPVVGTYRGYDVFTAPPPHGGPTLLAILNILEADDLPALGHNSPAYIHRVAMAMKAAFADRNPWNGDPEFVDVPLEWMISKQRAAEWQAHLDAGREIEVSFAIPGAPDTTHLSVVDDQGTCVALTHSLGSSSGVITPGLGFMYNNSMVNFHPWPGHRNSIAARKSRSTGMTPTIVYKDGHPVLVIGAPGATRIITSVVQVILNVLDFEMSVSDAVIAPRFDCEGDLIKCQARIPEYVCAEVRKKHPIRRLPQSHGGLALVHAIALDEETGKLSGAADTGAGGMALEA